LNRRPTGSQPPRGGAAFRGNARANPPHRPAPPPPPASVTAEGHVCVAQIGAAHGVRGEVRLRSFTQDPAGVKKYGPFTTTDGRTIVLQSLRPAGEMFVARIEGVADRTAAEALRNVRLYVPREKLPPAGEDEFYHADLIGLAAVDRAGETIGRVVAVHNFGAGDLVELARPDGGETVFLPFTKAVVPEIDIAAGRMLVEVPEGALDADGPAPEGEE